MKNLLLLFIAFLLIIGTLQAKEQNVKITNEMIYQKLVEIEKRQAIFEEKFNQIDRRFEQIDKRLELMQNYIDKRFEDVNKRFEDINKRFEDINKRFEDINKRFEQLYTFLWIITGIFTTLTLGIIGFAYWDRRTIIRKAKDETLEEFQKEEKLKELYNALKQLAKKDPELAKILRQFNIL